MHDAYFDRTHLPKFGTVGRGNQALADRFFAYYGAVFADGALSARMKSLTALAVAHAVQCPYCIDAYTSDSLEKGADLEQMTEAVQVAAWVRGGAVLDYGAQMLALAGQATGSASLPSPDAYFSRDHGPGRERLAEGPFAAWERAVRAEGELEAARGAGDADAIAKAEKRLEMSRYYEATRELSFRLTEWSKSLEGTERRFVICSGGGPGIMEAANRGASEAKGENIGLNISLPFEQNDNPYITRRLSFMFHYFFMRKFWFMYLAKAFLVMPGGFGTLDEFLEVVTLVQTLKIKKKVPIVLFGKTYWESILNFDPMVEFGTISATDLDLFFMTDSIDEAYEHITQHLLEHAMKVPEDDFLTL